MGIEYRTLEEYKEDVFDELDDDTRLEWMYLMGKQLCDIDKIVKENSFEVFTKEFGNISVVYLDELLEVLGDPDE